MSGHVINQNVREAAAAYIPVIEAARPAYADAIREESIVKLSVCVFRALAPHADDLDPAGAAILLGACHLIIRFRAYGMTSEAEAMSAVLSERIPAG